MIARNHSERGFSLAEVLVATALMAVILLALFGLVTGGVRRAYGGKTMTQATTLAQSVMERANVLEPQFLLSASSTAVTATDEWTKTSATTILEAADAVPSPPTSPIPANTRNAWRTLLLNADLPASATYPAKLNISMIPRPAGRNFGDAAMVQIIVDVTWYEFGTRRRQVRLQSLNLRTSAGL